MYKQSPSRGLKSKGVKLKHVLQVCVLLAICFWLIYQVKHSEKKIGGFDASDEKVVDNVQVDSEILRFGRKDLPRATEIGTRGGEKESEEENKPEEDELEREDVKTRETEEEQGRGDDETEENELEKKDAEREHERGEEEVDDDKEKEDNEEDVEENRTQNVEKEFPEKDEHFDADEDERAENVEKEFRGKDEHSDADEDEDGRKEDLSDVEDIQEVNKRGDGENADTHDAREEQYKADDASSEVALRVRSIIPKTENVTLDQANDIFGELDIEHKREIKSSDTRDVDSKEELDEEHPALSVGLQTVINANSSQITDVDESSSSRTNEDAEVIQNDPIDTFDINVAEEEKESTVDLDTLPDIKMEGQEAEEAMAE
ncbi:hypothetical protein RND81_09G134000 [Saponaria officinalis]|uniref:Uncharacterized protein n=1 Tax=Saponaria officinalis TaxID=3572 RepID=A0AAW1IK82_SAPOF